jgi:hypothetical protein
MDEDIKWMKMKWMKKNVMNDFLLSISFSIFGMLLIFGLGFVFPTINPYVVIKWIIIVAGVMFAFAFIKYVLYMIMKMRMMRMMKGEWKDMPEMKKRGAKK